MKLPKNYFENLSQPKYREYLKLLPNIHQEHVQLVTMLIFTFVALSLFGIFAINPTLSTIVSLKKQLADSEVLHEGLKTKINNLSQLQQQYTQLTDSLPIVFAAVPQTPSVPLLSGQIQALSKQNKLTITEFNVSEVQLTTLNLPQAFGSSFTFSYQATGNYNDMVSFIATLTHMSRIVTIESIGITRDSKENNLQLTIRGRQYFKP